MFTIYLNPGALYELCAARLGIFAEPCAFSFRAYAKLKALHEERRFAVILDDQCLGYGLLLMKRLNIPVIATIHHPLPTDRQRHMEQANGFRQKWRVKQGWAKMA